MEKLEIISLSGHKKNRHAVQGWVIYVHLGIDRKALYVGRSRRGSARAWESHPTPVGPEDEVLIYKVPLELRPYMAELEKLVTAEWKPRDLGKAGNMRREASASVRARRALESERLEEGRRVGQEFLDNFRRALGIKDLTL